MNKSHHRLIFNKSRGCMMAVLETASGGATGAAGATVSASAAPLMNQLQDGIASSLQTAGLNADVAKGIASGIAGLTAAGEGQFWVEFNTKMLKCQLAQQG